MRLAMQTTTIVLGLTALCSAASAATLRVPQDYASIQDAVNAAQPGDRVRVGPGRWCGATISKPVRLDGCGLAVIAGCAAPTLDALPLRVGFFLSAGASGTQVRGFVFDGFGVSNSNTAPLAFGVFSRGADDVAVEANVVFGTVQAVTNTGGSGWNVDRNAVFALTAFTCDGFCGGGSAIVFQQRNVAAPRAIGNGAAHDFIAGAIPDGLDEFAMAGVVLYGQDGATVAHNLLAIPHNPKAQGDGEGIEVSDRCCGDPTPFDTSIDYILFRNDGRASQIAVRVTLDASGGTGNSQGAFIAKNRGVLDIDGQITVGLRRIAPSAEAAPRWHLFE
jgi:hypothetical protein